MANLGRCCDTSCCVNDAVCCTIDITERSREIIWTNVTTFLINGTIMVENNGSPGSPSAGLIVNEAPVTGFIVAPGDCRSITLNDLNSIGIVGADGPGTANVKVSFSLNYKF